MGCTGGGGAGLHPSSYGCYQVLAPCFLVFFFREPPQWCTRSNELPRGGLPTMF